MTLTGRDLSLRYGDVTALDGVDLTVGDGEVLSVLGPSGSGKSTMLRVVAGLEPTAGGTVAWDGEDLTRVPPHRRRFGLMFQDHALFPHRDVLANVGFGLRMAGRPRDEVVTRAGAALARVGLDGFERRRASELSGGEQQRVALARAIAPEPRLLMLDEPLGSLDRELRDRLVVELRALFTDLGLSAVFVTHDHDEAFAIADRVMLLRSGRVEQVGTPAEVWRRPATPAAARFLGFRNEVVVDGEHRLVRADGLRVEETGAISTVVTGRTFRRDHFLVTVVDQAGASYEVEIRDTTEPPPVGAELHLTVDLPNSVLASPGQVPRD